MRGSRPGTIPTNILRPQTSRLLSIRPRVDITLRTQIPRIMSTHHRKRCRDISRTVPCRLTIHGDRMGRRRWLHVRGGETGVRRLVRIILRIHGIEHARLWNGVVRHVVRHLVEVIRLGFECWLLDTRQGRSHIGHVHCPWCMCS